MSLLARRLCLPRIAVLSLSILLAVPAAAETYGARLELDEVTPIAELLADPQSFAGERVRIEGVVTDVCPKKGCWMTLAEHEGGEALRVKVDDDVIVFPDSAKGRRAAAEGVVVVRTQTREQYLGWARHLAEERGESFDPSTVGDGPHLFVEIQGSGAEIAER